jgi:predicted transcriptional regulator
MSKSKLPPLSEAQMEIINIVWDQGEATVGSILKTLAERRPLSRATVSTMVSRLEEKGWLRHRVIGGTFLYSVTRPRGKILPRLVHQFIDTAFQGSAEGLVLTLVEEGRLSAEEVKRIRAILDKADAEKRRKKR